MVNWLCPYMINETISLQGAKLSHLDSNVPCMPMYRVYISQLLRFAHTCDRYSDFLARHKRLVRTLLDQGFRYGVLCRKIQTVLPVPPFLDPALFPLSDAASPGGCRYTGSVMAHPHSAGWSSGDWHQPIINFTLSLVSPCLFPPFFNFCFVNF